MNRHVNQDLFSRAEKMFHFNADRSDKASPLAGTGNLSVQLWSRWNTRLSDFARSIEGTGATLFQGALWLETWYETFAAAPRTEPLIVGVENRHTGQLLFVLPLCRYRENGLRVIGFPDFGLADYNAPLVHPDFTPTRRDMTALMGEICEMLPRADLLKLEKIPERIGNTTNPLTLINGLHESNLCHFGIEITDSWEDYWSSLKRNFRKDQRRRWRVLEKQGETSFVWCREQQEIASLLHTLKRQQKERLQRLNLPFLLDDPSLQAFYDTITRQGCTNGPVIFTALLVDGEPVATLCGFGDGRHYAMTLSGYETGAWSKSSPGRLLTERTMQKLHEQGYSYFDFTIGDEPYKKYFAREQGALLEYFRPLSAKGLPRVAWMKLKASQRKSPLLRALKKALGR